MALSQDSTQRKHPAHLSHITARKPVADRLPLHRPGPVKEPGCGDSGLHASSALQHPSTRERAKARLSLFPAAQSHGALSKPRREGFGRWLYRASGNLDLASGSRLALTLSGF